MPRKKHSVEKVAFTWLGRLQFTRSQKCGFHNARSMVDVVIFSADDTIVKNYSVDKDDTVLMPIIFQLPELTLQ